MHLFFESKSGSFMQNMGTTVEPGETRSIPLSSRSCDSGSSANKEAVRIGEGMMLKRPRVVAECWRTGARASVPAANAPTAQ